ncbi:hypothetical protein SAMN06295912_102276 [Sphingomonas laterariae]|uniref:Uncharacterized protein n=1 Tax=Edaphosphingomonas laterariae TaxID=861865 RepID=A0A239CM32_9SPHN|nr:hypothetical protein [Sphingomonas laterariae]SNS20942.1 hypothetical protein SAMN06295912_102276 [Sphingomonas laterariae]
MNAVRSLASMIEQPAPRPVIHPWDYVRLRRKAAGLTIAQAARPYWHRPEHRDDVESNIARLEQTGFRMMPTLEAADMSRAFPFSLDVYHQLCTLPPHQHPRLCAGCGWDQWTDQIDRQGNDVTWSEDNADLCTRCAEADRKPDNF